MESGSTKGSTLDIDIAYLFGELSLRSVLIVGNVTNTIVNELKKDGVVVSEITLSQITAQVDNFAKNYDLIIVSHSLTQVFSSSEDIVVKNMCRYSDNVFIQFGEFDVNVDVTFIVQLFAKQGFLADVDLSARGTKNSLLFRKATMSNSKIIGWYDERLRTAERESMLRRDLAIDYRNELTDLSMQFTTTKRLLAARIEELEKELIVVEAKFEHIENSMGWQIARRLQLFRARIAPPTSIRDQIVDEVFQASPEYRWKIIRQSTYRLFKELISYSTKSIKNKYAQLVYHPSDNPVNFQAIETHLPVIPHQSDVAIVICIHNALDDVRRCLDSVLEHTTHPYRLILVDDGSNEPTKTFLKQFALRHSATLLRNDDALGYTYAANKGLKEAEEAFVILLNSDTIVTKEWVDRMITTADSSEAIGLVGPLSNTASWQSIPQIDKNGDWAENPLPTGITVEKMGKLVAQYSGRLYPQSPFLNGFCLMIKQKVIQDIGYFDEDSFGTGYGEEDDYAIRAQKYGWRLAWADDVYIYHAQSKSYTTTRRKKLSKRAGKKLIDKHGSAIIHEGVKICRYGSVFEGIRIHTQRMLEREGWISKGSTLFTGKRILFILPVIGPGGGANVVIDEAMAMQKMGVDVTLFNLTQYKHRFEQGYPHLKLSIFFGEPQDIAILANDYDAVIATFNTSVEWLESVIVDNGRPTQAYYIQGFEPYIYSPGTKEYETALASYALISDMKRFTKTEWTRSEVKKFTGVDSSIIGISINTDLFRPRPRLEPDYPTRPLRVAAMVRPGSSYRAPELTMKLLQKVMKHYKRRVEIVIFGIEKTNPEFTHLPNNFPMVVAGILNQKQVARLLNEIDIFIDVSSHQAMGLTALEAMACGKAVIVPENGGAVEFAHHEINSLVVDTTSFEQCWGAMQRLIEDDDLRMRLQRQALIDVSQYYPEKPAFKILQTLFDL